MRYSYFPVHRSRLLPKRDQALMCPRFTQSDGPQPRDCVFIATPGLTNPGHRSTVAATCRRRYDERLDLASAVLVRAALREHGIGTDVHYPARGARRGGRVAIRNRTGSAHRDVGCNHAAAPATRMATDRGNRLVPEVGVEPTSHKGHRDLNPARFPISPLRPALAASRAHSLPSRIRTCRLDVRSVAL